MLEKADNQSTPRPATRDACIALVEWNWVGHHPTYFCLFAEALLSLGVQVRALCPAPEEVARKLGGLPCDWLARLSVEKLPGWAGAPRGTPEGWKNLVSTARSLRVLDRLLRKSSRRPDLVFFACVHDWKFYHFGTLRPWFRWKWAGLYVHSFGFRPTKSPLYEHHRKWAKPERFLGTGKPAALATLDEGVVEKVEAMIGAGKCAVFPDIADATAPEIGDDTLAGKLRRQAAGRKIVLLSGTLYPQRGVDQFLKTALANPQWCFALVGEIPYFAEQGEGKALLERFLAEHPGVFYHPHKVPDGAVYNALVASCDAVWSVHVDWPGSSNTLTKAALFERPVLVGDGHLLAERVREFRLGEVCQEDSTASASQALQTMLDAPEEWVTQKQPQWREYRQKHSPERLRAAFEKILTHV